MTRRGHALNKCALNSEVHLITRVYGILVHANHRKTEMITLLTATVCIYQCACVSQFSVCICACVCQWACISVHVCICARVHVYGDTGGSM